MKSCASLVLCFVVVHAAFADETVRRERHFPEWGDNLAKGKPTKQSSTYRGAEASRAVDGNRDPLYKSSSCTHTQRNNKPWWRVDLESEEEVGVVRITNRQESPDRLNRFFIFIGNVDGRISGNTKVVAYHGKFGAGKTKEFFLDLNKRGRYVYIQLMDEGFLTLCEVEVFAAMRVGNLQKKLSPNIAKGKAARQSSTSDNGDPNRAVDGNKDPRYAANSCSHTGNDHQAWWRVDLGNEEEVLVVKITNRQEASSRLRRIRIFVGNVDGKPSDNPEVMTYTGGFKAGETKDFVLGYNNRGRYVTIQLLDQNFLTLCEVEVFAARPDIENMGPYNVAKGRPASQSSTHHGADASRAVDGNRNPVFVGLSCTHTEIGVPWWQVDLEREEEVLEVKITNRQESHRRLQQLHIYIGNNGDDGPSNTEAYFIEKNFGRGETKSLVIRSGTRGRYVFVSLGYRTFMSICEVEVYVKRARPQITKIDKDRPPSFNIGACSFTKRNNDYVVGSGSLSVSCNLGVVLSHFFPEANFDTITGSLADADNFPMERIRFENKNGVKRVYFDTTSRTSLELIPRRMTLAATDVKMNFGWRFDQFDPEKPKISMRGTTSYGSHRSVDIIMEKTSSGPDYDVTLSLRSFHVQDFLTNFEIDVDELIEVELTNAKIALGLNSMQIHSPTVKGVISLGNGFEMTATGIIAAPLLPSEAYKFYVIVQDFKEATSDTSHATFAKPIAAIFAVFKGESLPDRMFSLTGLPVPDLQFYSGVNEVVVTAASKEIYNINTKELSEIAEHYIPAEGLSVIKKGLSIMHHKPNTNDQILDNKEKKMERLLFRSSITNKKISWHAQGNINLPIKDLSKLVTLDNKGIDQSKVPSKTKGLLVDIEYLVESDAIRFDVNLTESVHVLDSGLVSLSKSVLTFTMEKEGFSYSDWKVSGKGNEIILDEIVAVTLTEGEHGTHVTGTSDIFDLATLRNRTNAEPLEEDLASKFDFAMNLPFSEMRYDVSFEESKILRFKGFAALASKPEIEILYAVPGGTPTLKVGIRFDQKLLHEVINMFYGEEIMKSSWMKFNSIGIVMKITQTPKIIFDNDVLKETDESFHSGIGISANGLDLRSCQNSGWKLCDFLSLHYTVNAGFSYKGALTGDVVRLLGDVGVPNGIQLGPGITFYAGKMKIWASSNTGYGEKIKVFGTARFAVTSEYFTAHIKDDGTNMLQLTIVSLKIYLDYQRPELHSSLSTYSRRLLGPINFVGLWPVFLQNEIPATKALEKLILYGRIRIGTDEDSTLELFSDYRMNIYLSNNPADMVYQFMATKKHVPFSDVANAFGITKVDPLLKDAVFKGHLVAGYTSVDEVWEVKEHNLKVKKGLHFYGKLEVSTGKKYKATINLLENMQLETRLHFPPLRYGSKTISDDGRPSFKYVNVYLYDKDSEQMIGPDLVVGGSFRKLEGYCETVGLKGKFATEIELGNGKTFYYVIRMTGKMYKEVEGAEIILKTKGKDKPEKFSFMYRVDLRTQAQTHAKESLREALADVKAQVVKGKETAVKVLSETEKLLKRYETEEAGHNKEMQRIRDQIQMLNSKIDISILDVSTDCIDKCRTVAMPGIEWQQSCIDETGQRNMKCLTWSEDAEKVVNVMCLVKCEAKKIAASTSATENVREIRVLVNRYKEAKYLAENVAKLTALVREAVDIARKAKVIVDSSTNIETQITRLLEQADKDGLVQITSLLVDSPVDAIVPPCLPFQLAFTLNTRPAIHHSGNYDICFNGEFYKNVAVRILRSAYPSIDDMYKALEEAELRYVQIETVKKSLVRVNNDMTKEKSSRRFHVAHAKHDAVDRYLLKNAERRIPGFTTKGDHTVMAFAHYSPWAAIRRSIPFATVGKHASQKYNFTSLQEQSHCQQTRSIISAYKDITSGIETISKNYEHGKRLFQNSRRSIESDMIKSHEDIMTMMNATKLRAADKRDMIFWYRYTKEGMKDYLKTFSNKLLQQNTNGLSFYRHELSSFYGKNDFFDALHEIGHSAYKRSNVRTAKKEQHVTDFGQTGQELRHLLFGKEVTLELASASISKLNGQVDALYQSAVSCY